MRKQFFAALVIIALLFASTAPAKASSYGQIIISGIGLVDGYVIVYASSYSYAGWNCQECATTGWWYPIGTTHVFWFPRAGNEEAYTMFLTSYALGKKVFVTASVESLQYASIIACRMTLGNNSGVVMGNF